MSDFLKDTVLCQSCGAPNPPDQELCEKCGAVMPGVLQAREEKRQLEQKLAELPPEIRSQIETLEKQIADEGPKMAILIQLSNLYKDVGLREKAIDAMQQAADLEPGNNFLQQKLRLLIDPATPSPGHTIAIERAEAQTAKYTRITMIVMGLLALALVGWIVSKVFFSPTFLIAKGTGNNDTVMPRFSSDSQMIAYIEAPKASLFGMLEAMEGKEKGETWIMAGPVRGDHKQVTKITRGRNTWLDFAWRPGAYEITYVAEAWYDKEFDLKDADFGAKIMNVDIATGVAEELVKGNEFAWNRNGKFLAFVNQSWRNRDQNGLFVFNTETGIVDKVSHMECSHPSWSPTEDVLIFQGQDHDKIESMIRQLHANAGTDAAAVDEAYDKLSRYAGDIYKFELTSMRLTQLTENGYYRQPTFTPDGNRIAALTYSNYENLENRLITIAPDGTDERIVISPGEGFETFGNFSFSPDGNTVAFEGYFPNPKAPPPPNPDSAMALFAGGAINYVADVFLVNIDGSNVRRLESKKHKYKYNPVFSSDGKVLAYEVEYVEMRREIWGMKR